jgi:hypothetical protein
MSKIIQIYTNSFSKIVPIFCRKNNKICWGKKEKEKNRSWEKELELKNCNFMWELVKNQRWLILYYVTSFFYGYLLFIDDHRFFFWMLQSQRTGKFPLWKKNKSELKTRWFYLISRNWEWSGQVMNWQFIGGYLIVSFNLFYFFQTMFFVLYQRQFFFCVTTMVMRSKNRPDAGEGLSQFFNTHPDTSTKTTHVYPPTATKCLSYLLMILTHLTTFASRCEMACLIIRMAPKKHGYCFNKRLWLCNMSELPWVSMVDTP